MDAVALGFGLGAGGLSEAAVAGSSSGDLSSADLSVATLGAFAESVEGFDAWLEPSPSPAAGAVLVGELALVAGPAGLLAAGALEAGVLADEEEESGAACVAPGVSGC